ncbi:EpsG family protein [Vibrio tetraodonis]|uniref:EpsG family protein n=1 Tax=Vibrio tetraodonis TaxID=2231647 RepID=UPI0013B40D2E|nr:EpsG family protein [Vibrio tetraodonis]
MFALVLFYTTLIIYLVEKISVKRNVFLYFTATFPAIVFYIFVSSTQYYVGSDYPSYIYIYENPWVWGRYFDQGEYFFYYSLEFLNHLKLEPQALFFVFTLAQTLPIFYFFFKLKQRYNDVRLWLLFFIFLSVTNIYNNQLNGIRQYAAVVLVPLFAYLICDRKYVKSFFYLFLMKMMHASSLINVVIYPLKLFEKLKPNYLFLIFLLSTVIYLILPSLVPVALEVIGSYSHYIDGQYFESSDLSVVITKIYYLPVYLVFYYLYSKNTGNSKEGSFINSDLFRFFIVIFSFTYWAFLMSLKIGILSRLQSYFVFFNIFPIYYVLNFYYHKNFKFFIIILGFIVLPYLAKITFLAKNEFFYQSVIFN